MVVEMSWDAERVHPTPPSIGVVVNIIDLIMFDVVINAIVERVMLIGTGPASCGESIMDPHVNLVELTHW